VDYRAKECGKAVEFLVQLNNGTVPHNVISDVPTKRQIDFRLEDFVGKLDLDSFTMAGHSFGGATALLLSHRDQNSNKVFYSIPGCILSKMTN
jgi:hypothetical protein